MYDLTQSIERDGVWRLPERDDDLRGRLIYDPQAGASLKIYASGDLFGQLIQCAGPVTITGKIAGQPVSLLQCYSRGESLRDGFAEAAFRVNRILIGHAVQSLDELTCIGVWLQFTEIDPWVAPIVPLLRIDSVPQERGTNFSVRLTQDRQKYRASLQNGAEVRLDFATGWSEDRSRASFDAHAAFAVTCPEPVTAEAMIREFIRPLENFITFATGRINTVSIIQFVLVQPVRTTSDTAHLVYQPLQLRGPGGEWYFHQNGRGNFSLLDIEYTFGERISAWLTMYQKYRTVFDLVFGTINNSRQYLETRFVSLVQAAEGYHRQRPDMTRHRMTPQDYRALKKKVLKACPPETRDIVVRALQYANDVSLRMRLDELSIRFGPFVLGFSEEERQSFGADCAAARNSFAHHLPDPDLTTPDMLYEFTRYLLRLLVVAFMIEMGFGDAEVLHLMHRGASLTPDMRHGA